MPITIAPNKIIRGAQYIKDFCFSCGHTVPIYHVNTIHALTQVIGYVKFINAPYGNVLYRGQCRLYDSLEPSIYHGHKTAQDRAQQNSKQNLVIQKALADKKFCKYTHISDNSVSRIKLTSIFQHYGIPTQYLDVVDNHWTALWFGLNKYHVHENGGMYCKYEQRHIDYLDAINQRALLSNDEYEEYAEKFYQYIILIAVSAGGSYNANGITIGDDTIAVNLRSALPSTFLRPHAQHGWTIRRKTTAGLFGLDMAPNVVGILRMRIDDVDKWLGNGELLSERGLFPDPQNDLGYGVLLQHTEFFEGTGLQIPYFT